MDLKEYFDELYEVRRKDARGRPFYFYFRNATVEEELEFRRRLNRQNTRLEGRNRAIVEPSDVALKAPIYHFEKTCVKITTSNGTGAMAEVPRDQWQYIPEDLKNDAWGDFRARFTTDETEKLTD